VPPGLAAVAEELDNVIGGSRKHDNFGHEPIRARIGGIPYEIDRSVENVVLSEESNEIALQVSGGPIDQRGGDGIAHWGPVEATDARRIRGK
jgi:hypothetical protein